MARSWIEETVESGLKRIVKVFLSSAILFVVPSYQTVGRREDGA